MPRPLRLHSETGIYHVMARGSRRRVIFHDSEDKKRFVNIILNKKKDDGFRLFAYCIMDNHYHLLIKEENENLSTIMKMINSSYAIYYNNRYEGMGHVFQDRFRSEPVNNDEYLLGVARYIHNNPKKAGITNSCQDYSWSSYNQYIYYKKNNELLDVSFILDLYSDNINNAIKGFMNFTESDNTDIYLDEHSEKEESDRVRKFIDQASNENHLSIAELINDRKYINIRNEIIRNIKSTTTLSQSKVAEILGVGRNIIKNV